MTKRVWSLLLALALCLSLLPVPVWAAEGGDTSGDTTTEDYIVQVTKTAQSGTETEVKQYTDLPTAFKDVNSNTFTDPNRDGLISKVEVTLLENGTIYNLNDLNFGSPTWGFPKYPLTFDCTNGVEVVIDLNGCTLKRTASEMQQGILSVTEGSVTLKNGTLDLDDSAADNPAQAIELPAGDNNQTLTLENMTVKVADINTANTYRTAKGYAIRAEGGELCIKSGAYGKVHINNQNSAKAQLSGGSYDSVACNSDDNKYADLLVQGYIFVKQSDGSYIDPGTMKNEANNENIKNIQVIPCTEHQFADGECEKCGYVCEHTNVSEAEGVYTCSTCEMPMWAKDDSGKYHISLAEALEGVANGGTVTMLATPPLDYDEIGFCYDVDGNYVDKTVTLVMNGHSLSCEGTPALLVESGKLIINDDAVLSQISTETAQAAVFVDNNEKNKDRGTLEFEGKATLTGGLFIQNYGKLVGGLKEGSVLTSNGTYSVSVEHSIDTYTSVAQLLAPGCAFAKKNDPTQLVNGYVDKLNEDVIVVAHTHSFTNGVCACGYTCSEHHFENGVCTTCGYKCPHPSDKVSEADGVYTCSDCTTQMAVKVTVNSVDTYYAKSFDRTNTENTLQVLLNDDTITPSGSTVTLLMDNLDAYAFVDGGKNITLNLNGKTLAENTQGIAIDPGSTLTVTGEGGSTRPANAGEQDYSYAFNVRGGTLKFDDNFGGTFNGIRVGSQDNTSGTLTSTREEPDSIKIGTLQIDDSNAKISFKQGTFDKIATLMPNVSVTLGNLLGIWKDAEGNDVRSGNAFQYTTGDKAFVPYNTVITQGNPVENVKTAACHHDSLHGDNVCDYCGWERLVAIYTTSSGVVGTMNPATEWKEDAINTAANTAFGTWNSMGGTLKLFTDFTLANCTITNKYANAIDLNGCKITGGTLTLADGVNVTITDSSAGKTGSFANVTVNAGANLIVDGVAVDTITATGKTEDGKAPSITLKEGTKFNNINLSNSGLVLADCLEPGGCIVSRKDLLISRAIHGGDAYTCTVGRIPGTVTASKKTGSIPYNGAVSKNLFPTVQTNDGSTPKLSYAWYRRTDDSSLLIGTATMGNSEYNWIPEDNAFQAVNIDDTLDAICVITAKNEQNDLLWETAVTGYELTVAKGTAFVTTAPKAVPDLTYSGSAKNLITAGNGTGGTMQYSLTENGPYSTTIPTGENADEYTVWYKVVGDGNHEDTEPQQIKVTIAPKEVSITGTEVQPSKVYDGTTAADIINLGNLNGKENGDELTIFAGNANYSDKNVGTGKTVTFRGFMLGGKDNGNYVLKAQPASVTAAITKAASTVSTAPTAKALTYNGSAQELVNAGTTADGTMVYSTEQNGTYSESIPTGTKAGNYTVWYKVAGDKNHNDSTPVSVSASIAKAQATVTVKDKTAYVNSTAPDLSNPELDKDYTVSGLFGGDKLTTAPTLNYVDAEGNEVTPDMTKTGEAAAIKASGASPGDNYTVRYENGKLTVSRRSSSSSSGSTTPATPGKTEITTNPDGSIKITPPKNSGETKVEIPVKDVTPGTVAIIVKPDGTEEIVKDALPTENGIELTVDGSVTVKIVDNAKEFVDTKGHWAEDAIDFVSARGLVSGMTETTFAPNAPTTRAQLWTILARQADADLTGGSTWYEKAQAWAKTSGISDGSDPDGNITRAQMVTMLWRAAGSPAVSGSSAFTDVPGDSYYAQAVAWAAEKGITTGVGDGKFDPNGTCTRAQIATFLYRTYVNKI